MIPHFWSASTQTCASFFATSARLLYESLANKDFTLEDVAQIQEDAAMLGSWDWLYGKQMPFTFSCEERFDWGSVQIRLQIESGTIIYAEVYTDAMDWYLAEALELKLTGCRFMPADLEQALAKYPDVLGLLKKTM